MDLDKRRVLEKPGKHGADLCACVWDTESLVFRDIDACHLRPTDRILKINVPNVKHESDLRGKHRKYLIKGVRNQEEWLLLKTSTHQHSRWFSLVLSPTPMHLAFCSHTSSSNSALVESSGGETSSKSMKGVHLPEGSVETEHKVLPSPSQPKEPIPPPTWALATMFRVEKCTPCTFNLEGK